MHRDAGPPNWKCIYIFFSVGVQRRDAFIRVPKGPRTTRQTYIKSQKVRGRRDGRTEGQTDGLTDGHIILPLKGFEPVACRRMRCVQLWAE